MAIKQWHIDAGITGKPNGRYRITITKNAPKFSVIAAADTLTLHNTDLVSDDTGFVVDKKDEEGGLVLVTDISEFIFLSPFIYSGITDGVETGVIDLTSAKKTLFEDIFSDDTARYRLRFSRQKSDNSWEHIFCGSFRREDIQFSDIGIVHNAGTVDEISVKEVRVQCNSLWVDLQETTFSDLTFSSADTYGGGKESFWVGLVKQAQANQDPRIQEYRDGDNPKFNEGAGIKAEGNLIGNVSSPPALNGETVIIGVKTYTFQTVLTNADGNVLAGATMNASLDNLIQAINLIPSGSGTKYAAAMTANTQVEVLPDWTGQFQSFFQGVKVRALDGGAAGNSIATTETVTGAAWNSATLTGGADAGSNSDLGLNSTTVFTGRSDWKYNSAGADVFPYGLNPIKVSTVLDRIFTHSDIVYGYTLDVSCITRKCQRWDDATQKFILHTTPFQGVTGEVNAMDEIWLCYNYLLGVDPYTTNELDSPYTYKPTDSVADFVRDVCLYGVYRLVCGVDSSGDPTVLFEDRTSITNVNALTGAYEQECLIAESSAEDEFVIPPVVSLKYKGDTDVIWIDHKPKGDEETVEIEIPFRAHALADVDGDVYGRHLIYDDGADILEQQKINYSIYGAFAYGYKENTKGSETFPTPQNSYSAAGSSVWSGFFAFNLLQYKDDAASLTENGLELYAKAYAQCLRLTGGVTITKEYNSILNPNGSDDTLWNRIGNTTVTHRNGVDKNLTAKSVSIGYRENTVKYQFTEQPDSYTSLADVKTIIDNSGGTSGQGSSGSNGGNTSGGGSTPSSSTAITNYVATDPSTDVRNIVQSVGDKKELILRKSAAGQTANILEVQERTGANLVLINSDGTIKSSIQNAVQLSPYGTSAGNTGEIRFLELAANGTHYVSLKAPDSLAASNTYVFPSAYPTTTNRILACSTAGVWSWIHKFDGVVVDVDAVSPLESNNGVDVNGEIVPVVSISGIFAFGSVGQAIRVASGGTTMEWFTPATGALTYFTESLNTAAPNATVHVVQLLATDSATNVDAVFSPKGSGALLTDIPDNTAAGGDKRGDYAVDLQGVRSTANRVASGTYTTISGGYDNAATGNYSDVSGGYSNAATGLGANVDGGWSNAANGDYSNVEGGQSNTAGGAESAVLGGRNNNASGTNAVILGGDTLTISGARSIGFNGNNAGHTLTMSVSATNTFAIANVDIWLANNDGTARQLRFYEPNSTTGAFPPAGIKYTSFQAGAQSVDINYTLPLAYPIANGQALVSQTDGTTSWGIPTGATGSLIRAPQVLTSGTSYTTPAGCTGIIVEVIAGGGGGGGCSSVAANAAVGGGGAAGGYAKKYFTVSPSTAYTYAIGASGAAGANTGGTGGTGGDSTFTVSGTTVTAKGGLGGVGQTAGTLAAQVIGGGTGGVSTNGDINSGGASGGWAHRLSGSIGMSGYGGSSQYGSGGHNLNAAGTGNAGLGFGSGGGGGAVLAGSAAVTGGAGAQGVIIVTEFY